MLIKQDSMVKSFAFDKSIAAGKMPF